MSSEKLPPSVDVIVMGTGLPESIASASLSRIGKKVLHIDQNEYYGGLWATFNFDSLLKWLDSWSEEGKTIITSDMNSSVEDSNDHFSPGGAMVIRNKVIKSFIAEANSFVNHCENESEVNKVDSNNEQVSYEEETKDDFKQEKDGSPIESEETALNSENYEKAKIEQDLKERKSRQQLSIVSQAKINNKAPDISLEDFKTLSRKFNLDIAPKFLYSAGPLVEAILKANISHYTEFKIVDRILTINEEIIEVPCNRSDVFSSQFLTVIEKRILMKFLKFCMEQDFDNPSEELKSVSSVTFKEFLQSRRLSENLQQFVIYSIAMVKPDESALIGLKETHHFLSSLNRYGKSPFIWPLFGVGELPQAFCRMSAVFGCLYCLHRPPSCIKIDNKNGIDGDKSFKVSMGNEVVECRHIIMNREYLPERYISAKTKPPEVSKAILITDSSIMTSESEHVSFLTIPPVQGKEELVRVIEIGPASSACPSGLFVLYLIANTTNRAVEDLEDYTKLLTSEACNSETPKPKLLWSLYYNEVNGNSDITNLPENIFVANMPDISLGFADAVSNAKEIFKKICPTEEFLMKVPNAEDIVWDTNEESKENYNGEGNKENESNSDDSMQPKLQNDVEQEIKSKFQEEEDKPKDDGQ